MKIPFMHRTGKNLTLQYFFSYFAVVIVVLSLLLSYAYASFYSFHKNKLMEQYQVRMLLLQNNIEKQIGQMHAATGQMMKNRDMRPFEFPSDVDRVIRIKDLIDGCKATIPDTYAMFLRFYDGNAVVGTNGAYLTKNFIEKEILFSAISPAELLNQLNTTTAIRIFPVQELSGYITSRNVSVLPIFMPLWQVNGERCGTALFLVPYSALEKQINDILGEDTTVFILNDGQMLLSRAVSGAHFDLSSQSDGKIRYENKDYNVLYLRGSAYGLEYYIFVPESAVSSAMASSVQMLLLVAAVIATLSILMINRLVQRSMKPIQRLRSAFIDSQSTGNDLAEIRDYIQSLIDEKAALIEARENALPLRKADFLRWFLTNDFADTDELLARAEDIQLNIDRAYYVVGIIAKPTEPDYELTPEKFDHFFGSAVSGVSRFLDMHEKLVFLALADQAEALSGFVREKFDGIRTCCSGITMAVSQVHQNIQESQQAYFEAETAFEMRFVKGNAEVICFPDSEAMDVQYSHDVHQTVERLAAALYAGDAPRVFDSLRIISESMQKLDVSLFAFRCIYTDILNAVVKEARRIDLDNVQMYDVFQLSRCLSWSDMNRLLYDICSKIIRQKIESESPVIPEAVAQAHKIIENNFTKSEFSINDIAQQVGMSDSKLSIAFKAAYHMTPKECLIHFRMRLARRLLLETAMPVKDIALECGYYDVSAFNRRFKSYTGLTPQQYKKQNTIDSSDLTEE